jgi:hypothetical protein
MRLRNDMPLQGLRSRAVVSTAQLSSMLLTCGSTVVRSSGGGDCTPALVRRLRAFKGLDFPVQIEPSRQP